ncbi:unannotated protein [freshwater metagenome]|uniref:Unannotated protein n=1 Tax=freshwater metagenome TaxID=449393 RepID=A0A6J6PQ71_9ZZZZ|nr:DUF4115 domain-containing protein [Actinomycetota bacterium]MSW63196.1 DUF4115 domain-containing protein [Actinomycetota bacterium]MSX89705.1 DUF4115 domain-containing protein [Actinomycetota bacterium]MSZ63507.1 DUF4115 domain-containing protein [Actinomycetota bacterium]MTA58176.1 DUF4115 domain-containing protein [Actinomycetota bacterium]
MTLGTLIAKARIDASLSIDELASATNLRATLLREIERNDFSHCGGATYARGHIRNIAKMLNADEKELLRIFDEEHGIEKRTMQDLLVENNVMRKFDENRKVSWRALAIISVACLGIAGVAQIVISNVTSINVIAPTASPSATPSNEVTPTPTPESSQASVFSTGTGVEVVVTAARAKSWIFVSDAAGRTLFSGQLDQGVRKSFSTDLRLDIKVGNAGGVDLTVNGTPVPSIGVDGAVVSVSYGVDS